MAAPGKHPLVRGPACSGAANPLRLDPRSVPALCMSAVGKRRRQRPALTSGTPWPAGERVLSTLSPLPLPRPTMVTTSEVRVRWGELGSGVGDTWDLLHSSLAPSPVLQGAGLRDREQAVCPCSSHPAGVCRPLSLVSFLPLPTGGSLHWLQRPYPPHTAQ